MKEVSVSELRKQLREADRATFMVLEASLAADPRKGVKAALDAARKRLDAEDAESARLESLYTFERELASQKSGSKDAVILGLDEVGRGPLAGPLTIGGVVLGNSDLIPGLNDSKQVAPEKRDRIALEIRKKAAAYTVIHVPPEEIDRKGMASSLRAAFTRAISDIEAQGVKVEVILLDGNPLHIDTREINVVKGDAKCASIAAASILAKVERDALMVGYDAEYPGYGFASNKGYGSAEHIAAIEEHGLSLIHRASFCTAFTQPKLF